MAVKYKRCLPWSDGQYRGLDHGGESVVVVAEEGVFWSVCGGDKVGTAMHKWPTDKHFCSWLGLAPKHHISGGQVLRSRPRKHRNRAAQAFRRAAQSVLRADCALGAFYRRLTGRLGPAQALVTTAHTIARTVYHLLKGRVPYHASLGPPR